jgi:hypothetical protein
MKRQLLLLNAICAALAIAVGSLRMMPGFHTAPLLVISPLMTLIALNVTIAVRLTIIRKLALGILGLGLALTLGEGAAFYCMPFLQAGAGGRTVSYIPTSGKPYLIHDDVLGHVPTGDNVVAVDYRVDDLSKKLIYTLDHNNLRITPPSSLEDAPAILFFGCSLTFGDGVGDCEDFPYLVGLAERERFQAYNFAFSGQGPNHMYSKVRSGEVSSAMGKRTPALALYMAIPAHVRRVLGQYHWSRGEPRYVLEAGALRFRGCFGAAGVWPLVGRALWKIQLYRLFEQAMCSLAQRRAVTDGQVALFVALAERSQGELRKNWPGLPFVVLFRDDGSTDSDRLIHGLRAAGVRTLKLSEEVPELYADPLRYHLSPNDSHFNSAGHRLLARFIIDGLESGRLFEGGQRLP